MKNKVFVGMHNIASLMQGWKLGLEENGYETITAVHLPNGSIVDNNNIDYKLYELGKSKVSFFKQFPFYPLNYLRGKSTNPFDYVWGEAIKQCDTFVFIWFSFQPNYEDYARLKQLGKKIITFFVGDDIRWITSMQQDFSQAGLLPIEYSKDSMNGFDEKYLTQKLSFLRTAEKYSDIILSHPNQSQLALRPYHQVFTIVNPNNFLHQPTQRAKNPMIVHAPSSAHFKGTRFILPAIERLKNEGYEFEFKLIQNMPYQQALEEYAKADILIGQLFTPYAGTQDREGLACGKVVLTSIGRKYAKVPEDCPFVDVNPHNLYDELKAIIENYDLRCKLAAQGRAYVEKYHSPKAVVKRVLYALNTPKEQRQYDFYPTFFRNDFLPEKEYVSLYNQWTAYVKDCDWYKAHVPTGERDGLIF